MAKTKAQLDSDIADYIAATSLANVRAAIRALAVGISEYIHEANGVILLSKIVIPKVARGEDLGTRAMKLLTDYADRTRQRIALSPSDSFGGSSVSRLRSFYKRFGFFENKGRRKDFAISETMIRDPVTVSSRVR